ncbi:Rv3235 family protein [Actinacidiphila alni]|uniref:Rv3235 family protein n=1 Tax=Actinacidiphila alni TaxID=380248 RepID=UPI0015A6C612|nr:Rv3235 family protein [Actinacidiphila alni]
MARPLPRPPAPHVWFAGRLLDVLTGRRPLTSLAGRVRDEAYQRLWELHAARADWRRRVRGRTPYVYRCRCFRTADGALEVAAVVALDQDVFRALAFRLEPAAPDGPAATAPDWRCTAVQAR